jgi:glycine/serine hydroxymethyltransferase
MQRIAELFNKAYENRNNDKILAKIKEEVAEMTKKFPIPGIK